MRRKIVAGNWKMNKNYWQTCAFIDPLLNYTEGNDLGGVEVIIAPAYPFLHYAYQSTKDTRVKVAAQDLSAHPAGAYTGEVSADMLCSAGIQTVIVGHSERRHYFGEDTSLLKQKINLALSAQMEVIYCLGETAEARRDEVQFQVVEAQLDALQGLKAESLQRVILAYEPLWAIGSGQTATPQQAQQMHRHIRGLIAQGFGPHAAAHVPVLYGGSLKPENAAALFAQTDVDGGLVGGAALATDSFIGVVEGFFQ